MANAMKKMTPARKSKAEPRITVAKATRPMGVSDMMSREPKSKAGSMKQMYKTMISRSGSTGHRGRNF